MSATQDLTGAVAVVTGASSGIGRSYARTLSGAGATVVLVARSADRLAAVAEALPGPSLVVPGDVSDTAFCTEVAARTLAEHGRIDVLLSNAGVYVPGPFAETDLGALQELVGVNVLGAMAMVRAVLPAMVEAGHGDVVMTSSVSGHQSIHWEPVYSASKHAVQAFTHGVRRQLVGTGVRMGAIAPGVVLNELWGVAEGADVAAEVAAGRGITSEDVADAVLWMLTRPRHVAIRDLVILPTNQEI
jgi:ribitol 2-dehydrogenase